MPSATRALALATLLAASLAGADVTRQFEAALAAPTGSIRVPAGAVTLHHEIVVPAATHDLDLDAHGVTLQFAPDFQGRAAIVLAGGRNIHLTGVSMDGNRSGIVHAAQDLAPSDVPFARFTKGNGILAEKVSGLRLDTMTFQNMSGFAILVSASDQVRIKDITVSDSGSLNARKRNNATGGILLEEGTTHFEVSRCSLTKILGNGIWTHSLLASPRNADGLISTNKIVTVARDAIQVGHATRVTVEKNTGAEIGFPVEAVDREAEAIPVAIDTAGNTDATSYRDNIFQEVNGKCIDLDGFHDGEVRNNSCINHEDRDAYPNSNYGIVMNNSNPGMQSRNILVWGNHLEGFLYGGLLVIGSGHRVSHNHFLRLNMAHCNQEYVRFGCLYAAGEPNLLRSGIYLRDKAHRPADTRNNIIEDNEITGFGIGTECVVLGPGVEAAQNRIAHNDCQDDAPVSARNQPLSGDGAGAITREMAFTSFLTGGSSKRSNTSSSPSRQVE